MQASILPKFHPELNPTEHVWGKAKTSTRNQCDYSFSSLHRKVTPTLSHPWHGPYRVVTSVDHQNATAIKVFFPQEDALQVHRPRVHPASSDFPAGYYWYEGFCHGPGRSPEWIDSLTEDTEEPCYNLRDHPLARPDIAWVKQPRGKE